MTFENLNKFDGIINLHVDYDTTKFQPIWRSSESRYYPTLATDFSKWFESLDVKWYDVVPLSQILIKH